MALGSPAGNAVLKRHDLTGCERPYNTNPFVGNRLNRVCLCALCSYAVSLRKTGNRFLAGMAVMGAASERTGRAGGAWKAERKAA